jgi:diacylglycerol kinase
VAAIRNEPNMRIHLAAALLVGAAGWWLHITRAEWFALAVAVGLVFMAELMNSAIELLCDHVSPERNATIGKVKDIAAGAVLVAALTALVIGAIVFWPYVKLKMESAGGG